MNWNGDFLLNSIVRLGWISKVYTHTEDAIESQAVPWGKKNFWDGDKLIPPLMATHKPVKLDPSQLASAKETPHPTSAKKNTPIELHLIIAFNCQVNHVVLI